jgi:hypothetical protein
MTDISYQFLSDFFVNYIPFTPTAGQIALFQSDLALVSPYIMGAALKEVREGTLGKILIYRPNEWREKIFQVYNRKVAEHAQLFPIFHSFETAFRSTVTLTIEQHYRQPRWWMPIHAALRAGKDARNIGVIGTCPISRDAAHLIGRIIYAIEGDKLQRSIVSRCQNGYEFLECCDLSHISQLIDQHWKLFGPKFSRMSRSAFAAKFTRVQDARNDVYHHKSVARMANVVSAAEELLDCLDFSLAFVYKKITHTTPVPPTFAKAIQPRHNTW